MHKKKRKIRVFNKVCICLIFIGLVYLGGIFLLEKMTEPVTENADYKTYDITINNAEGVCQFLADNNLVKNKTAFYIKAQLSGIAGRFGKGKYELSPSMTADELISVLQSDGIKEESTVQITIPEGLTIEDMAELLYSKKIIYDKEVFLDKCKEPSDHPAVRGLEAGSGKYVMEGYLFPDTYEFYLNSSSDMVIDRMLDRFDEVYTEAFEAKMKEYGFSKNDVVILASIIEKESKKQDFAKVSSVLHNRINKEMALQVDASVRYVNNLENTISITSEQYALDSPYNTYKNKGLPPTAICNPSKEAMEAVLYPDEKYMVDEYLYFCLTDYESGNMVFSKTYAEHLENVKKYKDNWRDYDGALD